MAFVSVGKTDIGNVRLNNEDVYVCLPNHGFFALADGMGGVQGGEIAAYEAVWALVRAIDGGSRLGPALLKKAVQQANRIIYRLSKKNPSLKGMGTTLSCCLVEGKTLFWVHIGDSRLYCHRQGTLIQLTKDHSLYNELVERGALSPYEAATVPPHILSRALGTQSSVTCETGNFPIEPGDLFLLCSDGLSDYASERGIKTILQKEHSLEDKVMDLIALAKASGGCDNITVILIAYSS